MKGSHVSTPAVIGLTIITVLLLFLAFFHFRNLMSFPAFLDEIDHIDWANDLYQFQPFTGARNGKLFGLWWMALFGLTDNGAFFLVRAATVLFNVLGAAALYSLARHLVNVSAGILVVLLYALSPYSFFYSRLALVDSYVTTWAILAAWLTLRTIKHNRPRDAVLCGLALVAAVLAKATGVVLVIIPALAFLVLIPVSRWKHHLRSFVLLYATFALVAIGGYVGLRWRGYNYFKTATSVVGTTESTNILSRVIHNLGAIGDIDSHYLSLPFLLVAFALVVYLLFRRPRLALFLAGATLIPLTGLLLFASKMSARYFQFHEPFLLLLVAVAVIVLSLDLQQRAPRVGYAVPVIPVILWGALFAYPFQVRAIQDPVSLDLPALDRLEYITSDAAGFAVPEVANYLSQKAQTEPQTPNVVVGLFANCNALRYYVSTPQVQVECPLLKLDGSHQPRVIALLDELVKNDSPVWLVFEESPYISLEGIELDLEKTTEFTRPDALTSLQVFRVLPDT